MQSGRSLWDSIRGVFQPNPPSSNPIKSNIATNQILGTGVQQLESSQSSALNTAINKARLAQASASTTGERIGETVGTVVRSVTNPNLTSNIFKFAEMGGGGGMGLGGGETVVDEEPEEAVVGVGGEEDGGRDDGRTYVRPSGVRNYLTSTPTAVQPETDITKYLERATSSFREMYGDDPNYEQLERQYLATLEGAYNQIVGEGGTLDQARAIADQQFGIAREQTERGFRETRQQLAEQAFLSERQMQQQLASRGLGGTGLAQLGRVQQKIAEGGAASSLYRDFVQSVQDLSLQEAQSQLGFAQAEADLNLALTRDLQDIQNRFRQERQAYSQWKGNTITGLAEAIRTGNFQSYQMQMDEWNRGLQAAQILDQESRDAAAFQLDIIQEIYGSLITGAQNREDLTDEEKDAEISRLQNEMTLKMDQVGSATGLSPGDLASGILEANPTPATTTGGFTDRLLVGTGNDLAASVAENRATIRDRRNQGLFGQFANVNWFGLNPQR